MARTGRRPGSPQTRKAILDAARGQFSRTGYRGATIRAIAADAAVDPALIHHYFGTKRELFTAALELPLDHGIPAAILTGPRRGIGERFIRTYLRVWDGAETRQRLSGMFRSAAVDEQAATMMREFVVETILDPIVAELHVDEPRLRVNLVASQLLGMAMARYVIRLEPITSLPVEDLVRLYAPVLQRSLTGPLGR
jgi:AcrR family transcriptional regulator